MALLSYYDIGFASVANGSTAVTGTGTQWLTALRENDVFVGKDGRSVRVASIESATALTLARAWPGDSQTSDVYEVRITPAPSEITASVRELLEKLRQGLWLTPNATGTLAERAGFDSARRGFIYMQVDVDPFVVFVKQTDTAADWSPGYSPQQGPSGPFTTIEIGNTTTLDPGSEATIDPVQVGDVVTLNFGIPAGTIIQAGTTTTLAPDQPASVDFDPIAGGFELNFNIPRGPTGDINGVTPFWVSRLGNDADAEAARTGLGAGDLSGPLSATDSRVALFDGVTGKRLKDSGSIIQASATDATANALLRVGAFGLGASIAPQITDADALAATGDYYVPATWVGSPIAGAAGGNQGTLTHMSYGISTYAAQEHSQIVSPYMKRRRVRDAGVWGPWRSDFERGSNANGEYIRFADGTQICTRKITDLYATTGTFSNIWGSTAGSMLYRNIVVTMAASFINSDFAVTADVTTRGVIRLSGANSPTDVLVQFAFENDTQPVPFTVIAIGRWF